MALAEVIRSGAPARLDSAHVIPLKKGQRCLGALHVERAAGFGPDRLAMLDLLAGQIDAVTLAQLVQQFRQAFGA